MSVRAPSTRGLALLGVSGKCRSATITFVPADHCPRSSGRPWMATSGQIPVAADKVGRHATEGRVSRQPTVVGDSETSRTVARPPKQRSVGLPLGHRAALPTPFPIRAANDGHGGSIAVTVAQPSPGSIPW